VHDGTLSLESEVNDGTAVTIFLPAERVVERSAVLPAVKAIT
jgi:signal transduction histidine kinase